MDCQSPPTSLLSLPPAKSAPSVLWPSHYDISALNEKMGVKPTYVTYGENKAEFNSDSPLSPESQAELQKRVDEAGGEFVAPWHAIAECHPSTVTQRIRTRAHVLRRRQPLARGMADGVSPFDDFLVELVFARTERRAWFATAARGVGREMLADSTEYDAAATAY